MSETDPRVIAEAQKITNFLQTLIPDQDDFAVGSLVAKWVLVIDVIEPDGTHSLLRPSQENMPIWESRGLLRAGLDSGWDDGDL